MEKDKILFAVIIRRLRDKQMKIHTLICTRQIAFRGNSVSGNISHNLSD